MLNENANEEACIASGDFLTRVCHAAALRGGWWNVDDYGRALCPPHTAAVKIALAHSELSEALEGFRCGGADTHLPHRESACVELADAVIRCFDLAGARGWWLGEVIAEKLSYNAQRADHTAEARLSVGGKNF